MEAVALIPQLFMIWKSGAVNGYMMTYICLMTIYRGMYIFNWVYRYYYESYYDLIVATSGVIETCVGLIGVMGALTLRLKSGGSCGSNSPPRPSIYILPSLYEQFEREYKILQSEEKDEKQKKPTDTVVEYAHPTQPLQASP